MRHDDDADAPPGTDIAVIGMAGRFPGARDIESFWRNLRDGVESVTQFSPEQLEGEGLSPELARNPAYVRARGVLDDVELFDAGFFGYSPRDAVSIDPQQRLFLESCWEALEVAGYDPRRFRGLVGVYAGASASSYGALAARGGIDGAAVGLGNELTFLTTRVSYKLDLMGPSCPVQTACSTSLVAVHLACQGLLNAECDMALAGGASIRVPQRSGYVYREGGILSPDGHCRSFDAGARGTVFSNGLGVVVLRRLDDALADGDHVRAVIKGSAINNDGSRKASFTAPGVVGQSEVIADALAAAQAEPDSIGYVEAHGSATALGDSIEIQALARAFGPPDGAPERCALGSVKANLGHLDAAAGIAGLIKTVLALEHRELPPTPHFERPNPDIRFEGTRFFVNAARREWKSEAGAPRRAGVSSFGFGGTNAHVVLEEAPPGVPAEPGLPCQLLVLSARSAETLDAVSARLAARLRAAPELDLADVAHTLQVGRRAFPHRRAVAVRSTSDAAEVLESGDPRRVLGGHHDAEERPVAFMFTGQGAQHPGMAAGLYRAEPRFRERLDECCALLEPRLGFDLRELLYPDGGADPELESRLSRTAMAQPALFAVEYALARLWMALGVAPAAFIGHSVGEWVAACLSGIVSLEDALAVVAERGRLMEQMPEGSMTAVPLPEEEVRGLLADDLWLAAVNGPALCVVSGEEEAVARLEGRLAESGVEPRRLRTSHAFHSGLMDGAVAPFVEAVGRVRLRPPRIPCVSNLTGTWLTDAEAQDPAFWGRQLREPVRFTAGLTELSREGSRVLLEVGPGGVLAGMARQQLGRDPAFPVVASLPGARDREDALDFFLAALGRLWLSGASVDWKALHAGARRRRVPLPTTPFQRERYWPEAGARPGKRPSKPAPREGRNPEVREWFYAPSWTDSSLPTPLGRDGGSRAGETWLLFAGDSTASAAIAARLGQLGHRVVSVRPGEGYARTAEDAFTIRAAHADDYRKLLEELLRSGSAPSRVLHLWTAGPGEPEERSAFSSSDVSLGFGSLMLLARGLSQVSLPGSLPIAVVTAGACDVHGRELLRPSRATVLGVCRVIPQEQPELSCRLFDLELGAPVPVDALLHDVASASADALVAYRGRRRWVQAYRSLPLDPAPAMPGRLRAGGVYLITGGLGGIGLELAESLAGIGARLVLTGRSGLPPEAEWDRLAQSRDGVARRICRVRSLRDRGAEVLVVRADSGDVRAMRSAFAAAEERFGEVHGVIHAAGLLGGDAFRTIAETDSEAVESQFAAKVTGLSVLDEVIDERELDFCMLVSSLSVVLGGIRYAAYASANAFMDGFAERRNRDARFPWLTVNWDGWLRREDVARLEAAGRPVQGLVMTPAEGVDAFQRILSVDAGSRIVVSVGDLEARLERWVRTGAAPGAEPAPSPRNRFPRPRLQTEYAAPEGDTERAVAEIWADLLGLERVGANDNFFELGGDSFLGIQVISRVKKDLGARVSAVSLYEGPTVRSLCGIIGASEVATSAVDEKAPAGDQTRADEVSAPLETEPQASR